MGGATSTAPRASGTAMSATVVRRSSTRSRASFARSRRIRRSATWRTRRRSHSPSASRGSRRCRIRASSCASAAAMRSTPRPSFARQYWSALDFSERTHLISRTYAYHGTHGFGTSLAMEPLRQGYGPLVDSVSHVAYDSPEALADEIERVGPDRVAAFFCARRRSRERPDRRAVLERSDLLQGSPGVMGRFTAALRGAGVLLRAQCTGVAIGPPLIVERGHPRDRRGDPRRARRGLNLRAAGRPRSRRGRRASRPGGRRPGAASDPGRARGRRRRGSAAPRRRSRQAHVPDASSARAGSPRRGRALRRSPPCDGPQHAPRGRERAAPDERRHGDIAMSIRSTSRSGRSPSSALASASRSASSSNPASSVTSMTAPRSPASCTGSSGCAGRAARRSLIPSLLRARP